MELTQHERDLIVRLVRHVVEGFGERGTEDEARVAVARYLVDLGERLPNPTTALELEPSATDPRVEETRVVLGREMNRLLADLGSDQAATDVMIEALDQLADILRLGWHREGK